MAFLGGVEPDTIPDWEFRSYGSMLGSGSFITPDVNNDGFDEILVRADESYSTAAYLFFGGAEVDTLYDVYLDGDGDSSTGCAYAGDVNGDGWGDVMLNDWADGKINVFFLHPGMGSVKSYDLLLEFPFVVGGNGRMGYAGDVNGDGVDDFMFASYSSSGVPGEVFIYSDTSLASVNRKPGTVNPTFTLLPNYPNPFNASTAISFKLQAASEIDLAIYNISGQRVWGLGSGVWTAGTHEVVWDAEGMASGTYLVRLTVEGKPSPSSIPVILLK